MSHALLTNLARPMIVLATIIWGSTFFILKNTLDEVNFRYSFLVKPPPGICI